MTTRTFAHSMGYEYSVLFSCARDAMRAYPGVIALPENICPEVYNALGPVSPTEAYLGFKKLRPIDQATGLADLPVHLYGYQARNHREDEIALDPLMTGWLRPLKAKSAIISFGRKKMVSLNYGGAFLTNDSRLVQHMNLFAQWNEDFTSLLNERIATLNAEIERRFRMIDLWDRYLGDRLRRIKKEQIMPWRVMRLAYLWVDRQVIVEAMREEHLSVGTNFQPIEGANEFGNTVMNFPLNGVSEKQIERTCEIIDRIQR